MKKTIALFLAAMMLFSLAACGNKTETPEAEVQPTAGLANPMVEYTELASLNEQTGGKLCRPGVMGVDEEKFFIIGGSIAEYRFSLNGIQYVWRFSAQKDNDICGIYEDGGTLFADVAFVTDLQYAANGAFAARWVNDEGQYTLTITDESSISAMNIDNFKNAAEELSTVTKAQ